MAQQIWQSSRECCRDTVTQTFTGSGSHLQDATSARRKKARQRNQPGFVAKPLRVVIEAGRSALTFLNEPDHEQQDDRADHGADEPGSGTGRVQAESGTAVAGDERTGHAEQGGHDDAHVVVAGFDGAGDKGLYDVSSGT